MRQFHGLSRAFRCAGYCAVIIVCSCSSARSAERAAEAEAAASKTERVLVAAPAEQVAPVLDKPRPKCLLEYPKLKKQHEEGLKNVDVWLKTLKPEAFAKKFPGLVKLANSSEVADRLRALKAIGALEDLSAISIMVASMRTRGSAEKDEAARQLANSVYSVYHYSGRTIPKHLAPLLPVFVETLIKAGDEPNLRASCFQAIGCLAGPEWLPLVKDLSGSRHPAVTQWSGWAIKQLKERGAKKE